jgi:hypothetical protein
LALDRQPHSTLADLRNTTQPLPVDGVEADDCRAAAEPQHRAEIMRLPGLELDRPARCEPAFDIKARLPVFDHARLPHLLPERD